MRRKENDLDNLVNALIAASLDEYEEEDTEDGITAEELAAVYMQILLAFMNEGFDRDEAFSLLLNTVG